MSKPPRKALRTVVIVVFTPLAIVLLSAVHATRTCNALMLDELPPPRVGTHFALNPNRYIDDIEELGFKPGWVVVYATRNKMFGDAFHVSMFGKIVARGTPVLVAEHRVKDREAIEDFSKWIVQADAQLSEGMKFSDAVAILGEPLLTTTNEGVCILAVFDYRPPGSSEIEWLTNGFVLTISNGIVTHKSHSYTARR